MRALAALFVATLAAGCVEAPRCTPRSVAAVPTPPPGPLPEALTAPPAPGMDWLKGYWAWDGERWVWSPGHWATRPKGEWWYPPELTRDESGRLQWTAPGYGCERREE